MTCIIIDPSYTNYDFKQMIVPTVPTAFNPLPINLSVAANQACFPYNGGYTANCFGWNPNLPVSGGYAYAWRFLSTNTPNKLSAGTTL